jgi:hypothetical protein
MVASFTLENCVTKSTLVSSCVIKVAEYHTSFLRRILMRFRVGMRLSALPSYGGLRPAQIICSTLAFSYMSGIRPDGGGSGGRGGINGVTCVGCCGGRAGRGCCDWCDCMGLNAGGGGGG